MNQLTKVLGIEKPIIQAPMHSMINAELVAAVSEAGRLGIFGVNPISVDEVKRSPKENLRAAVKFVKSKTDKPFAVQDFITKDNPEDDKNAMDIFDVIVEEKVPIVMVGGFNQVPSKVWIDLFHKNNIKVLYRPNHNTVEDTKKAIEFGVDVIGATGYEAGGEPTYNGLIDIVPLMADLVQDKIPLFAAGGIADPRQVKAVFDLGAQGVYVGTAFLNSEEAAVDEKIKKQAIKTNALDLKIFNFTPRFGRSLPGELPNEAAEMTKAGKSSEEVTKKVNGFMGLYLGDINGDLSKGWTGHGQGVSFVKDIKPAAEIVDDLYQGVPAE